MAFMSEFGAQANMRTRLVCGVLAVGGVVVQMLFVRFAFEHNSRLQLGADLTWWAYMLGTPLILLLLKGERRWRLAVFILWLAYVVLIFYVASHLD
jgi:hypothetical protein